MQQQHQFHAVHQQQQHQQQQSAAEIKDRLLQALDREYNVVDMEAALEVVSLLETTAVTREALEATRIGRLVNEMRKKTANELLARRAKDLVRRWRDMVARPPTENGTGGSGQGPGGPAPANHHRLMMQATSPASASASGRSGLAIPPTSPCLASSEASGASGGSTSPGLSFSVTLPSSLQSATGAIACSNNSSRPSTPSQLRQVAKSKALSPGPGRPGHHPHHHPHHPHHHHHATPTGALVDARHRSAAVKRPRDEPHGEETMTGFEVAEKRMKAGGSSSNGGQVEWPWLSGSTGVGGVGDEGSRDSRGSWGSQGDDRSLSSTKSRVRSSQSRSSPAAASASAKSQSAAGGVGGGADSLGASKASHDLAPADLLKEKFASIARVSKVKTTQELLEDLARRSGSPTIATARGSEAVPAAAALRRDAGASPPVSASRCSPSLSDSDGKQQIMAKFFQSTSHSAAAAASSATATRKAPPTSQVDEALAAILARLPPLDPDLSCADWIDADVATADLGDDDDAGGALSPPPVVRPPVTDEDVERLHTTAVDCVGGSRDFRQEFHEWHETLSVSSYNGDLLHVLPYVVIE